MTKLHELLDAKLSAMASSVLIELAENDLPPDERAILLGRMRAYEEIREVVSALKEATHG